MAAVKPTPMSPDWWVARLYKQLQAQAAEVAFYSDYYSGEHPLPWLAPQAREEFRRILHMTRTNYMGLVCDATAERLSVEGFRHGDDESADQDAQRIWQANNLDSDSDMAWLEALIGGRSYFLVAPNPDDATTPNIWVEHASQAIVEHVPGTNRRERKAGLKVWDDDWTQELHATLYLMDNGVQWLYKFKAARSRGKPQWTRREVTGEEWPANGRSDRLSLIEIPNNPRLLSGGVSELSDLTDIQDRINKTVADRLMTQDYGAFPQKWAVAWPNEDADGNPNTVDIGRNRMVTTDVKETQFGQWDAAPLDPYSMAKREDVKDIASRSRTPAQYLLGEMSNVNGETLKASESGHISKVKQRRRPFGEAAEEALRIAFGFADIARPSASRMETIWTNPEFRTEGELTDATVKKLASRITSLRQAREDVGYTATQIQRLEADDLAEFTADPILGASRALTEGGGVAPAGGL